MVLFGVNFNIYYLLLMGKVKSILRSEELRWYLGIIAGATLLIAWNTLSRWGGMLQSLRYAFFQVASVITTTGFATADFNLWPELSRMLLMVLMLVGAGGLQQGRQHSAFDGADAGGGLRRQHRRRHEGLPPHHYA